LLILKQVSTGVIFPLAKPKTTSFNKMLFFIAAWYD